MHLLSGEVAPALQVQTEHGVEPAGTNSQDAERIAQLESEIVELRREFETLRQEFAAFQKQFQ
jgi:uncharacterized protein YceH (UPF0502 family)